MFHEIKRYKESKSLNDISSLPTIRPEYLVQVTRTSSDQVGLIYNEDFNRANALIFHDLKPATAS